MTEPERAERNPDSYFFRIFSKPFFKKGPLSTPVNDKGKLMEVGLVFAAVVFQRRIH